MIRVAAVEELDLTMPAISTDAMTRQASAALSEQRQAALDGGERAASWLDTPYSVRSFFPANTNAGCHRFFFLLDVGLRVRFNVNVRLASQVRWAPCIDITPTRLLVLMRVFRVFRPKQLPASFSPL